MSEVNILHRVVLVQDGKIIEKPISDNVQVHPIVSKVGVIKYDSQLVLKELKQRFPKCIFTWFSDPLEVPTVAPIDDRGPAVVPDPAAADASAAPATSPVETPSDLSGIAPVVCASLNCRATPEETATEKPRKSKWGLKS